MAVRFFIQGATWDVGFRVRQGFLQGMRIVPSAKTSKEAGQEIKNGKRRLGASRSLLCWHSIAARVPKSKDSQVQA